MDIVVKSFYRPYYLERCLKSIFLNVSGNYRVTILDDGTPEAYLTIIRRRFPQVHIIKSQEYALKVESIGSHLAGTTNYPNRSIPVLMWYEVIESSDDYFLLLEEDSWVIDSVSVDVLEEIMRAQNILILKVGWNANDRLVSRETVKLSDDVIELIPLIPVGNLFLMRHWLHDTYRIRSILLKLNLVSANHILPYFTLYTTASSIYKKDYWLYLWKNARPEIDEGAQLYRALRWFKERQVGRYARTVNEFVHTSFITASYNRFRLVDFDMIRLNRILNEAWVSGRLDAFQNFPEDFDLEDLKLIVNNKNDPACSASSWILWIDLFKNLHRQAGSHID